MTSERKNLSLVQNRVSNSKAKTLFVLEYFSPHIGGVETSFLNLITKMKRAYDITVVTVWLPGTKLEEEREGFKICRVKTPSFARRYWFTFLSIPKLLKVAKYQDIIHATTYNAALPAWVVAKLYKKKIVLTVHEVFGKEWFSLRESNKLFLWLFYLYEKLIFSLPFDCYIAVSKYTKKSLLQKFHLSPKKIEVVYNLVDSDFWDSKKYNGKKIRKKIGLEDNFLYLFFGRPGISKGVEYLVKAVPEIRKEVPGSKLILILSEEPKSRFNLIKKLVENLGIEDDVIFIPPVKQEELPNYIVAADCVVVPSLSEGFGYSALEASLLGVSVVATKVGALPEVISKNVEFVKPKSPQDISRAVVKLFSSDTIKNKYSEKLELDQIETLNRIYYELL